MRLLALLAALLAAPAPHATAEPDPADWAFDQAGVVAGLSGRAEAEIDRIARRLAPAAPVFVEEAVRTGAASRLALALGTRTELRLGASTEIRLARYLVDAGGVIELADGALVFDREGPPSAEPVEIRSPYGLVAVRGTEVFAGPSEGVFGVFVLRGSVDVVAGGARVTLGPGFGTSVVAPGAPPAPPLRWGEARAAAALASVAQPE